MDLCILRSRSHDFTNLNYTTNSDDLNIYVFSSIYSDSDSDAQDDKPARYYKYIFRVHWSL